jgi:hypothetical protein
MVKRYQSGNQKPYIEEGLPLWYLLAIVLSVLLRYTASDYLPLVFFSKQTTQWPKEQNDKQRSTKHYT